MAEVLITLGIVGVVAALTIPSIITKIHNKGYVEGFKKSYAVLQQATNEISNELGAPPQYWGFSKLCSTADCNYDANKNIANLYKKHLKLNDLNINVHGDYYSPYSDYQNKRFRYLNGESNAKPFYSQQNYMYICGDVLHLADGSSVSLIFEANSGGCYMWPFYNRKINLAFLVDVNGLKKPNQIGRDIFWFALYKNGKLLPYNISPYAETDISDCTKDGKGYSCAARIMLEGKMNY